MSNLNLHQIAKKFALYVTLLLCFGPAIHAAPKPPSKPVAVLHFDSFLGRGLTTKATFNGIEGTFLFDTGAGISSVSPDYAKRIDCKPWGQVTGFSMEGHRIDMAHCDGMTAQIAGQSLPIPVLGVSDGTDHMPPGAPHIDGTIGLDAFAGRKLTFSLANRRLVLESAPSMADRVAHARPLPIRLVREAEGAALAVVAGVETPAGLAWMELDSGNASPVCLMGKHLAPMFSADPAKREPQEVNVKLAGGIPVLAKFIVRDLILDGNIGTAFLLKWDLTLDLAEGKGWISTGA